MEFQDHFMLFPFGNKDIFSLLFLFLVLTIFRLEIYNVTESNREIPPNIRNWVFFPTENLGTLNSKVEILSA